MTQHRGELLSAVTEDELNVELFVDAQHRLNRVFLHTHADDHDARPLWRRRHDLVDHAGNTDALKNYGRSQRWASKPWWQLRGTGLVLPHRSLAPTLVRRLLC